MLSGSTYPAPPESTPMQEAVNNRNTQHFIGTAQTSYPFDSMRKPWTGENVFNSGNLVLDLLHNFFLECGARIHKMRVYEMTEHPVAREMFGYLLVLGGVHIIAYAKALEVITDVDLGKMLPIPNLDNKAFAHAKNFEDQGVHLRLYTFSDTDYKDIDKIWKGTHPIDGQPLKVIDGMPAGAAMPELNEIPEEFVRGSQKRILMKLLKD